MNRKLRLLLLIVSVLVALVPAATFAQDESEEDDLLLRVNGPITVGRDETLQNVVVISSDAIVDGTIDGSLFVIDGDAIVSGRVDTDVTVISGTLTLAPTAQVNNVSVIRGNLVREDGATVTGSISRSDLAIDAWSWRLFSAVFWVGMTLAVIAAGLIFAAVARRQLHIAGDMLVREIRPTLLGSIIIWIAMPIVMVLALFTIVGIPVGIGYLLFILPILWFLGYLVAGARLGRAILRSRVGSERPYLAVLIGLLVLQVIGIIPWFGGMIAFLAGVFGSGALLLMAWRSWRGSPIEPVGTQSRTVETMPA